MEVSKEINTMMDKAKIGVFTSTNKFISTIIFSLKHEWDDTIKTTKVEGNTVKYNPEFFKSLNDKQRISTLAHEAWHVALGHTFRIGNRDPKLFNNAADYVDNQILKESGYELPHGVLQDDKYSGLSTDEVYELLEAEDQEDENQDNQNDSDGSGNSPPLSNDIDFSVANSDADRQELEAETTMILTKAKIASEASGEDPGTIPGEVKRFIEEKLNPRLPWQKILRQYLRTFNKNNYSWSKPNKRFFPDMILPSLYSNSIGLIACAIDTSGSLKKEDLDDLLTEVSSIHRIFKPKEMIVMDCDYMIHNIHNVKQRDRIKDLTFSGRGGTRFDPVINHLNGLSTLPLVLIYFTDLYAPPLQVEPLYPVVWICNSKHEPHPIGKTIYID